MTTSVPEMVKELPVSATPPPGAVWPAMVTLEAARRALWMGMKPLTAKTIVRPSGGTVRMASWNEPGPSRLRLVTRNTSPPRPPVEDAANPSAPGKAGTVSPPVAGAGCIGTIANAARGMARMRRWWRRLRVTAWIRSKGQWLRSESITRPMPGPSPNALGV